MSGRAETVVRALTPEEIGPKDADDLTAAAARIRAVIAWSPYRRGEGVMGHPLPTRSQHVTQRSKAAPLGSNSSRTQAMELGVGQRARMSPDPAADL